MNFKQYATKYFVGQSNLLRQISPVIDSIKAGEKQNILLTAQSGYGKTFLAELVARYTKKRTKKSVGQVNPAILTVSAEILFLDEIHLEMNPELLYPAMDEHEYSFILATNEYDKLKEPVRNRCYEFIFERYTESDLARIVNSVLTNAGYNVSQSACYIIAEYCRRNPRIAKSTANRLALYFRYNRLPEAGEQVHELMAEALSLGEGGFTVRDHEYVEFLRSVGGIAGMRTIQSALNIPLKVIVDEIEPFLISKNMLEITSKGRRLIYD